MKAVTVKHIEGRCIPDIPVGTEFEVVTVVSDRGYAICEGLSVTSVWNDEYRPIKDKEEDG